MLRCFAPVRVRDVHQTSYEGFTDGGGRTVAPGVRTTVEVIDQDSNKHSLRVPNDEAPTLRALIGKDAVLTVDYQDGNGRAFLRFVQANPAPASKAA